MSNSNNRKSSILDRCMRIVVDERLEHDFKRYLDCNTTSNEVLQDRIHKHKRKQEEQQMKEVVQDMTQDYLKQGYKVDNLSNGSIGIYLGNDEDVQQQTQKASSNTEWTNVLKTGCRVNRKHQELIQKASNAQQENIPMTDKLTELRKDLLAYQGALRIEEANLRRAVRLDSLYTYTTGISIVAKVSRSAIANLKSKIELLECQIDTIEDHNHNQAVSLQKLSDARVSLLQAYTTGIGTDIAERALITAREQYNSIHGV